MQGDGMRPGQQHGRRLSMVQAGTFVVFVCLCLAYAAWGWADQITDFGGDSAAYMLQARLLSPFVATSEVLREAVRATPFPPLFPFLIGLFGAGFLAGHLIVIAALMAALACMWQWLREEGVGELQSAAIPLMFVLMPGTYFQALNIMSENPYLAASLLCILFERRAEAHGRDKTRWWWLSVAMAAAASLIRSAALPLLGALAIRLLMLRPRHWPRMMACAVLPMAVWLAWTAYLGTGIAVYAAQAAPAYSGNLVAQFLAQIAGELRGLLIGWIEDWLGEGRSNTLAAVAFVIGAASLAGWVRRLAALKFDAIYVALYLALLLLWPFPDAAQRLSYVIVPMLLVQAALLIHAAASACPMRWRRLLAASACGLCALLLLPPLLLTLSRFLAPVPPGMSLVRHTQGWYRTMDARNGLLSAQFLVKLVNDLPDVPGQVPEGQCIFSEKPTLVTLYSGRMSYFPPPSGSSDAQFRRDIGKCRFAYVLALTSPSFPEPFYPQGRVGARAVPLSTLMDDGGSYPFAQLLRIAD